MGEGAKKHDCQDAFAVKSWGFPEQELNEPFQYIHERMLQKSKTKNKNILKAKLTPNQFHKKGAYHFFAVFDGHGSSGKEASNTASDIMTAYLERHKSAIISCSKDYHRVKFLHQMFEHTE